jgi:L-ascorbate metabolism protein UlaG (beta-lactamase superfamily)
MQPPDDSLLFIGNATVLIRYAGLTLLTDPNFIHRGEEVPLGYGMSTVRLTDPALEIDDLPKLDAVVLSHYHGDHFDQLAEERLDRDLPIITTPEAADVLSDIGFRAADGLATWDSREVAGGSGSVRVTSLPVRHAPGALDIALPDVMGSCLEFWSDGPSSSGADAALRMYVSGDTLMYEGIREIHERVPQIDLALVHLGGTRVMGVTVTMDAEQGVELLETLRPDMCVPIHFDDYEAFKSPLSDFRDRVREHALDAHVTYLERGQSLSLGRSFARL